MSELKLKTDLLTWKVSMEDGVKKTERLEWIKSQKGYDIEETILLSKDNIVNYKEKIHTMYTVQRELIEDTARLVEDGTCYYDVEIEGGKWIRLSLEKGDFLVIPPGTNFRFSLDTKNYAKLRRYRNTILAATAWDDSGISVCTNETVSSLDEDSPSRSPVGESTSASDSSQHSPQSI